MIYMEKKFYDKAVWSLCWQLNDKSTFHYLLWQPLVKMTNRPLSQLKDEVFHKNHKRTWQEVPDIFLHYIY